MTDKYTLQESMGTPRFNDRCFTLSYKNTPKSPEVNIAEIYCAHWVVNLLDKCLNQTSRAGSKTSQAKRDAAKRNITKRWEKK